MQPDDFTFAFLAKAVADAGGRVHITAADLLRMNNGYMVEMEDDGRGGQILTLKERKPLSTTTKRILQGEIVEP